MLPLICVLLLTMSACAPTRKSMRIWYDRPAVSWMREALPVGNGYIGAMFFGGIEEEHVQFTEGSLWTGGPGAHPQYDCGNRDSACLFLPEVRRLLSENRAREAENIMQQRLTGQIDFSDTAYENTFGDFGAQQSMGELVISVLTQLEPSTGYKRSIDLSRGRGEVTFATGKIKHKRCFFGDYPDKIMLYAYRTNKPLSYSFLYLSPHIVDSLFFEDDELVCQARVGDNGMRYVTRFKFVTDGQLQFRHDTVFIHNAARFYICHTAATSYRNAYPVYDGNDPDRTCREIIMSIRQKSYRELAMTQLEDYAALFNRVKLELGRGFDCKPTNVRLEEYATGVQDLGLEELYFQYGRYLMISASRAGALPMNLQGKWNNSTRPPWACDYHFNINLEMLYWPAELTNLPECHIPLMDYITGLVEPGRVTACTHFGARGWTVNTMNNPFGFTAPGWDIGWGYFPGGGAWISRHLWTHYQYNSDTAFLRDTAFPIIREAARFWVDYLTDDGHGYLTSCPSYSPEHGKISRGASMDSQLAADIIQNCIDAYRVLNVCDSFLDTLKSVRDRIRPPEIGCWGQLKEWYEDVDDPHDRHRHLSHLYALYPACRITVRSTPALADAAKVSLEARGDGGTGWSLAWKINFWARLQAGDRAYALLRKIMNRTEAEEANMLDGGGTYDNLLCAHPPFQLDGNMGAVAGMSEMLLDPVDEKPLPALPAAWEKGRVKGLKTQNAKIVEIRWRHHRLSRFKYLDH